MRKIFFLVCLFSLYANAFDLIHPLNFKGTEKEKEEVLSFITKNVKDTYSKIGMDNPSTLRMMENQELKSFKELTSATNKVLLDDVISKYCNIGMCNYNTINMMYNEELKASKQKLAW